MSYPKGEYTSDELAELTRYLQDCARQKRVINYDEACQVASKFGRCEGPHDKRLWDLLGYISNDEVALGRPALSALVVTKEHNRPGAGFFVVEKELGRYLNDDDSTWLGELDALYKYWAKH